MYRDPIVDEIHMVRERIARESGYDLKRIVRDLREKEAEHPQRIVEDTGSPRSKGMDEKERKLYEKNR